MLHIHEKLCLKRSPGKRNPPTLIQPSSTSHDANWLWLGVIEYRNEWGLYNAIRMCARAPDWANQEPRHYSEEQEEEEWGKSSAGGPKEGGVLCKHKARSDEDIPQKRSLIFHFLVVCVTFVFDYKYCRAKR